MKRLDKAFLWIHRWSGILFAAVFIVVGISGTLLTFRYELQQVAHSELKVDAPGGQPDFAAIMTSFEHDLPGSRVRFLQTNPATPDFPVRAVIEMPDESVRVRYADPVSGEPIDGDTGEAFWRAMRDLHIFLMQGLPGLFVVFASGWVLIGCSLLGTWLWAPRLKKPKIALGVRWRANIRKLMLDLHNVTGIYLLAPMLLIALTGVTLILARISPTELPTPTVPAGDAELRDTALDGLHDALSTLRAVSPEGEVRQIRFPASDGRWFTFDVDDPGAGRRTVFIDAAGGRLLMARNEGDLPLWHRLKAELGVAIHEGYILGDIGRWLVFACGLTLSFGSVSGIWLWLVRRRRKRAAGPRTARSA